ncbi:MFS transporter [Nonomuraea glycinis]|uniref:MFS transporter n=1 Tax=Nonomuraea glycinis TaxID=2047744 RepID=UPI002E15F15F|nr:MFS transporter [Nonomuraea glycinis]
MSSLTRVFSAPADRLAGTLYVYTFLDEFVLLYPVYALLFTDTGLSVAEITSLFVIWSVTGMVLEVPSGAWADTVSRRLLLCLGQLLAATGFALWVIFPSYWAFAVGFVLWGACGALVSGAMEALVYESLDRHGQAGRYAQVMGRASSVGLVANALAIALAIPVFAAGGYLAVGAASVLACLLCSATALAFREHRATATAEDELGYWATMRAGLAEARGDRRVLRAVILLAVVTAIWGALEEYVPFLGTEAGVAATGIPVLVLIVWIGATGGGLLAGAARRLTERGLAVTLVAAALAMAGGALSGHPAGIVPIAVAFGLFQMSGVVADARLQDGITGPSRATVTSVAGLGTNVVTLFVYAGYGTVSSMTGHGVGFAVLAAPYVLVALWLVLRRRDQVDRRRPAPAKSGT